MRVWVCGCHHTHTHSHTHTQEEDAEAQAWPEAPDAVAFQRKAASYAAWAALPVEIANDQKEKKDANQRFRIPPFAAMPAAAVARLYVGGTQVAA